MLLRLFDSDFFDEFIALTYLHRPAKPGVHEYICRKLLSFPEEAVDCYLNQFCFLAVDGVPSAGDMVVEFCRKSFRIAVKVYWLLSALEQDRSGDSAVVRLRQRAEVAALEGKWEPPFTETHLSLPSGENGGGKGSIDLGGGERTVQRVSDHPSERMSDPPSDNLDLASSPLASRGYHGARSGRQGPKISPECSVADTVEDGEGPLSFAGPPGALRRSADGPGPLPSPEFRQKMLGSTLDLVDALSEASVMLRDVPAPKRPAALRAALEAIDLEIQQAHACGIGVIFPMFCADERVIRIPSRECQLLGSREKAPFLLTVEVLTPEPEAFLPTTLTSAASRRESAVSVGAPDGPAAIPHVPSRGALALRAGAGSPFAGVPLSHAPPPARSSEDGGGQARHLANLPAHSSFRKLQAELGGGAVETSGASESGSVRAAADGLERQTSRAAQVSRALASMRGDLPAVSVVMEVVQELAPPRPRGEEEASAGAASTSGRDGGLFFGLKRAMGLCAAPAAGERPTVRERVQVRFVLHGGIGLDLDLQTPRRMHHRVPSVEALEMMRKNVSKKSAPGMAKASKRLPPPLSNIGKKASQLGVPSKTSSAGLSEQLSRTPSLSNLSSISSVSQRSDSQHQRSSDMALSHSATSQLAASARARSKDAAMDELWPQRFARLKRASPFGSLPKWSVRQVIVKAGDDCRQELLAVQLLRELHDIWKEAGLPLYVRPYQVLVTSSHSALIEVIPDAMSIHSVKASMPPGSSLADWFFSRWERGTPECQSAQRNFAESMAAYSIIMYVLQAKDRHNGNMLIDSEGHVVHIDFGFMISNSPGNMSFETAPFKLTREFLEVMDSTADGKSSEIFDYFKVLCIQGFLALRKHRDRVMVLVEVMKNAALPCFKGGPRAIEAMHRRFHQNLTEEQCVQLVLQMISDSMDAWRTRQYDYYQRVLNGIL